LGARVVSMSNFAWFLHVRLETLGRLPAIAGRPSYRGSFPEVQSSASGRCVLDLDVLEHLAHHLNNRGVWGIRRLGQRFPSKQGPPSPLHKPINRSDILIIIFWFSFFVMRASPSPTGLPSGKRSQELLRRRLNNFGAALWWGPGSDSVNTHFAYLSAFSPRACARGAVRGSRGSASIDRRRQSSTRQSLEPTAGPSNLEPQSF